MQKKWNGLEDASKEFEEIPRVQLADPINLEDR
jgi:hypothetical protein